MATPQLNSRISLVSRSNIRYEGILYSIDLTDSNPTIALANVRSFGTENRKTDKHVPSSDEVYEYIIFRGSDIQELTMIERPQPLHPTMLNDPAIINSGMVPSYAQNNYMGYGFGNQNYMGMGMGMGQHYYNPYYMNTYYGGMYGSQHVNPQQGMEVPVGFDQHLPNSHKIPQFQETSTRGQIPAQQKTGLQPPSNQNATVKVNPNQPGAGAPSQPKNQNAASGVSPVPTPTITPTPIPASAPSALSSIPVVHNPPNLVDKDTKIKADLIPSHSTQNNHQAAQNTQNQPKNPSQTLAKDPQPKIEQHVAPQTTNPTTKSASPEQRKNSNNQNKGGRGGKLRWQEKGNGEKQGHKPTTNNHNENYQGGGRGGRGNRGGRMHRGGGRLGGGRINPGRTKIRFQEFDFDKTTELFNKEKEMKEIENRGQQQLLQEREFIVSAAADLASNLSKGTELNNDDLQSLDISVAYNPSTSIFDTLSCDTFDRIHSKKAPMDKKTRQKTRQDQKKMDEETFPGPGRNPGRHHQNRNNNSNNNNSNRGRGQKRVFRPVQKEKTAESIESRNE